MVQKPRKRRLKRNPVAKALKTLRPKVVRSRKAYTRKAKHPKRPEAEEESE